MDRRPPGALLVALLLAPGMAGAAGAPRSYDIRLLEERLTPPEGVPEAARAAIARRAAELQGRGERRVHLLVQLREVPGPAERQVLARQGLELGAFVPDSAWIAAAPVGLAVAAVARPEVRWAALWDADRKLHPRVRAGTWGPWARDPSRPGWVAALVQLHLDVPLTAGEALARTVGGVAMPPVAGLHGFTLWLPETQVAALAEQEEVLWVEEMPPTLAPANDGVVAGLRANGLGAIPYELDGEGVRLLVFDGGRVRATHQTFDPGTGSRVTTLDASPVLSHSTHVAGTAAGDGSGSPGGRGRGVAPAASILSAGYQQVGGPVPFRDTAGDVEADYALARNVHGADLATNSLSSNVAENGHPCSHEGDYGAASQLLDAIVRGDDPAVGGPLLVTWAAGNERTAGAPAGVCGANFATTPPPACAKNPIQVGAVNSDGSSLTEFSSWGPCDDGRLKPLLVAPGCETGLASGESFVLSSTAGSDASYGGGCGTSMATPAVAGVAALLIEDWRAKGHGGPTDRPMPALVKALLLHTARDLGPAGPDVMTGYGAVDAARAVEVLRRGNNALLIFASTAAKAFPLGGVAWGSDSVAHAEVDSFPVFAGSGTFKATLVWDDPAAAPFAAGALVNDLTLELVAPDGTIHRPWVLSPSSPHLPATRGVNAVDNQEQVVLENVVDGEWQLRVTGTSVPAGPQPYALVYTYETPDYDTGACTVATSGFETGAEGWTLAGAVRDFAPQSGPTEAVRLGGAEDTFHEVTRSFALPASAIERRPRADLSFRWHMTTEESLDLGGFGFDPFNVEVRDPATGAVLGVVDWRNDGWPQGRWMEAHRVDLTPWAGRTVEIAFTASNDFLAPTTFWIDDVTVATCLALPPVARTRSSRSLATEDGWVLESSETSGVGGTVFTGGPTKPEMLRVGDDAADRQYVSVLSFDTSSIPDAAQITSATLRLRRAAVEGTSPFTTHGACRVDVRAGGLGGSTGLAPVDFHAEATATVAGTLGAAVDALGWSEVALSAEGIAAIHKADRTQIRLRFETDDDDDLSADWVAYHSGDSQQLGDRPELVVGYLE